MYISQARGDRNKRFAAFLYGCVAVHVGTLRRVVVVSDKSGETKLTYTGDVSIII